MKDSLKEDKPLNKGQNACSQLFRDSAVAIAMHVAMLQSRAGSVQRVSLT